MGSTPSVTPRPCIAVAATAYCLPCRILLCGSCSLAHSHAGHTLVSLTEQGAKRIGEDVVVPIMREDFGSRKSNKELGQSSATAAEEFIVVEKTQQCCEECLGVSRKLPPEESKDLPRPKGTRFAHFYDAKISTLLIYRLDTQTVFSALGNVRSLPSGHASVQLANYIFITGGIDPVSMELLAKTVRLALSFSGPEMKLAITQRRNMRRPRSQHGLLSCGAGIVYSLGGVSRSGDCMKSCERYDVTKDSWTEIAPMNSARCCLAAAEFNNESVYVFGGRDLDGVLSTVEKLILEENKWHTISVQGDRWALAEGGCFRIPGRDEIMLFGGNGADGSCTSEVSVFDVEKKTIIRCKKGLHRREWFRGQSPAIYEGKVYVFGVYARDIHVYFTQSGMWETIWERDWERIMHVEKTEVEAATKCDKRSRSGSCSTRPELT